MMTMHNDPASNNLRTKGMLARFIGIAAIAVGFVVGIYGLEDTEGPWMKTAMGLLVTGMLAQGYALYCSVRRMHGFKDQPKA